MQRAGEGRDGGRKGHGEEELHVVPLPVPPLLKPDISEAAGAPKEVEKKWKAVGSRVREEQAGGPGAEG